MCHGMKITSLHRYDKVDEPERGHDLVCRSGPEVPCEWRTRRLALRKGPLRGIAEIRTFFRTNETPIYFVSATAFNLLGIDRWVRNFKFINYYDSFDGFHPNVFVPKERSAREFGSIEEICNYLLAHKEVADFVGRRGAGRQGRVPDVRRGDRAARGRARARGGVPVGLAPPPAGFEDRHDAARERGRRPQRAERDGSRERLRRADGARARRRARRRPRGADAVRRLRADDVLHRRRGGLEGAREGDRRSGHQGDAEDRSARVRDRRGHHASRHAGRSVDGGAHRASRSSRRTTAAGAATTSSPTC